MAVAGAAWSATMPVQSQFVIRPNTSSSSDGSPLCCVPYCSTSNSTTILCSPFRPRSFVKFSTTRLHEKGCPTDFGKRMPIIRASQEASASTSTLLVQEVEFVWKENASEVLLTGDFLKWDTKLPLEKGSSGIFSLKQKLGSGKYLYKFIVDGEWKHSSDCPTVPDGTGGLNNEVTVTDQVSSNGGAAETTTKQPATKGDGVGKSGATGEDSAAEKPSEARGSTNLEKPPPTTSEPPAKESGSSPPKPEAASKAVKESDGPQNTEKKSKPAAAAATKEGDKPSKPPAAASKEGDKPSRPPPAAAAGAKATAKGDDSAAKEGAPTPKRAAKAAPKKPVVKSLEATIQEDVIPSLTSALEKEESISDLDITWEENQLKTSFSKGVIPYCFWVFFPDGTIEGSRGSSLTSHGSPPSTVEPFLVDEKKINAELIVFWVKKRLFVQNLLSTN